MKFELDMDQIKKLREFDKEQDLVYRKKINKLDDPFIYGAIGGSLTISFTPTGLGDVVKLKHVSGNELDITDYDSW
jgi:hypothetical protein